jgi:hypothetical protein
MRYHFLILAFVIGSMGCTKPVKHDEVLAAKRAVQFAELAFVKQDAEKSYQLLSDATKGYVPFDKFKETLARLNPGVHPRSITAIEYEPMPGEKAIYIYLVGKNSGEDFSYTVTMEGTAATDYRVSKVTRGIGSFLPSTTEKKRFSNPISAGS